MYQPDATHPTKSTTKLSSSPRMRDSRDYEAFSEEARVADLNLDPRLSHHAAELQADEALGRLTVTTATAIQMEMVTSTNSTPSRSLLLDLGRAEASLFTIVAMTLSKSRLRSYRKPSTLTTARTTPSTVAVMTKDPNRRRYNRSNNDRTYAFIGLERIGGVLTYDVTDPTKFIQYINNRDFSVEFDPAAATSGESDAWRKAGDLGPEGLTFISAQIVPTASPC